MSSTRVNLFTPIKSPIPLTRKNTNVHPEAPYYSADELDALYNLPKSFPCDDWGDLTSEEEKYKGQNLKVFRHLLTLNGEIRFGREGRPNTHIPSHSIMGKGLAAGNTYVNPNSEIVKLNNRSGQTEPDAETLQYMVMAYRLITQKHPGIKIAEKIEIEFLYFSKTKPDTRTILTRDEFFTLGDELIESYKKNPSFFDGKGNFLFAYEHKELTPQRRRTNLFFEHRPTFGSPIECALNSPTLNRDNKDSNNAYAQALLELKNEITVLPNLPLEPMSHMFYNKPYPKMPSVKSFLNWRSKSPTINTHDALCLPRPIFVDEKAPDTPPQKLRR